MMNTKPNTANAKPNPDFGADSALRVMSRDGQRQVSSTHADEVRDQVRALGNGQDEGNQDNQQEDGGAPDERNMGEQMN